MNEGSAKWMRPRKQSYEAGPGSRLYRVVV